MRITAAFTRALLAFAGPCSFSLPCLPWRRSTPTAWASYDSTQSDVIFRIYSSRAMRIDVYLYASPLNSPEVLSFPLSANSGTNIFSTSIPVATLLAAGINGQVY